MNSIIKGKKVYLTPFTELHLNDANYLSWLRDYEVMKYIARDEYLEKKISFDEVKSYVNEMWESKLISFFAVHTCEDNVFIGTAKTNYLSESGIKTKTVDVGFMIGNRDYWGKGVFTDGMNVLCKYAFEIMGARKLTGWPVAANMGVIKAFLKMGFVEEGRLRKRILIGNEYYDQALFGCFRDEFIEL